LRRTQPAEAAKADRATTSGKTPGAVCLKAGRGLWEKLPEPQKTHQHCPIQHFEPIPTPRLLETSMNIRGCGDFQQVPRM
jgi:hypothetical protein